MLLAAELKMRVREKGLKECVAKGRSNLPSFLAIMRFSYMRFFCICFLIFVSDFLKRLYAFLLHNFLTRFPNEIFLGVMRCPYEICHVLLHNFLMIFRAFWPL
jgi:hypothetical protein